MKKIKKLTGILLLMTTQYGFGQFFHKTIRGKGEIVRKEFKIDNFSRLKMRGSMDFFLVDNAHQSNIVINTYANLIPYIEIKQKGDVLEIGLKKNINLICRGPFEVYIPVSRQTLKSIELLGSGDVNSELIFTAEDLEIGLIGSGDVSLSVAVENLEANLSGSGDLRIDGKAQTSELKLLGSGDLIAKRLISHQADAHLAGSGDLKFHVLEKLKVNLIGSGDVYYTGNPKDVDSRVIGSGDIHTD